MGERVSFETVRRIGRGLPHVEEATMYGKPALKVHGQMFVCMAAHKSAEPESLAVRTDFEQRAELLAADPDTYYITDHYKNYPAVLVRLGHVKADVLQDLVGMAYRYVAREAAGKGKRASS